jgi:phosphatidylglycerol:prolipoprotein diacylglycerol transferase
VYPYLDEFFWGDHLSTHLPFRFHSFGVMLAMAMGIAAWLCKREFDRLYSAQLLGSVTITAGDAQGHARRASASPSKLIPNMVIIAASAAIIGGIQPWGPVVAGFKLGPLGTYYGGLICASLAVLIYAWRKGLSLPRVLDAVAPGLMLAYAIGRIGCYLAGDGDWGPCSSLADKPSWIPAFLWSETFPRNILGVNVLPYTAATLQRMGIAVENCTLADGVFPTMLYEALLAIALFILLWRVREHRFKAGWLFSLYMVFNGIERFFIENIRINQRYLFALSQAQVIALILVALGALGLSLTMRSARRMSAS